MLLVALGALIELALLGLTATIAYIAGYSHAERILSATAPLENGDEKPDNVRLLTGRESPPPFLPGPSSDAAPHHQASHWQSQTHFEPAQLYSATTFQPRAAVRLSRGKTVATRAFSQSRSMQANSFTSSLASGH